MAIDGGYEHWTERLENAEVAVAAGMKTLAVAIQEQGKKLDAAILEIERLKGIVERMAPKPPQCLHQNPVTMPDGTIGCPDCYRFLIPLNAPNSAPHGPR